ncbi:MAG: hypothetical protein IKJ05_05500, partial [Oscillospiraceae bacterium]|nr:hypothetical protein [Oscillospiraceae bacterium]
AKLPTVIVKDSQGKIISPANYTVTYVIKEYGGKVAVFNPDETEPMAVYEVYVHLLPENDIELLRKGIPVDDDYTLQKALEDFGL